MSDPRSAAMNDARTRDRFIAFAFARGDLLVEIDHAGIVTFATGATQGLLGASADQMVGRPIADLVATDSAATLDRLLAAARRGDRLAPTAIVLARADRRRPGSIAGCPLHHQPDRYFLSFAADTIGLPTGLQDREPETGLLTRAGFEQAAERYVALGANMAPVTMTLVEVPALDGLRDRLTPDQGMRLSQDLGSTLAAVGVGEDAAGVLGPNRFGVLHSEELGPEDVRQRVLSTLRQFEQVSPDAVAARGIELGGPGLNRSDAAKAVLYALRQFADTGVSEALPSSLNESLAAAIDTAVTRVSGLRRMLDHGTFDLHFQPIVDLQTRAVHHQEALTRLPDGRSPFQTVSLAEEIGVITELDYLVAERSLQLLEATPTAVDIAVNISGRSIESAAFIAMFEALLERYRHVRSRMLLELTESAKIHDLSRAASVLQHLRKSGQKIYIDDFGSGAAAFHYLRALQVDAVKIDGLFVREISRNNRDRMFVKAIRLLCTEMGLATVAEQVESPQDAALLGSIGITYGQGYHFGKPSRWVATRTPGARAAR